MHLARKILQGNKIAIISKESSKIWPDVIWKIKEVHVFDQVVNKHCSYLAQYPLHVSI